jgi:RHS repeat-associated protein
MYKLCVWLVAAVILLAHAGLAIGQVLRDAPGLRAAAVPVTPSAGVTMNSTWRAATPEGGVSAEAPFGLVLHANPQDGVLSDSRFFGPIDLVTGSAQFHDVQIALPARVPWTIGTNYASPRSGVAVGNGLQGRGWFQFSQPELVRRQASPGSWQPGDSLVLVLGAAAYAEYQQIDTQSGVLAAVNGVAGAAVVNLAATGAPETVTIVDGEGTRVTFFGWNDAVPLPVRGQIWRVETEAGDVAYVGHASDPLLAISTGYAQGRLTVAFDSAGRRFVYGYSPQPIGGAVRLVGVAVEGLQAGIWREVARARYHYWGDSSVGLLPTGAGRGVAGDLAVIETVTPLSNGIVDSMGSPASIIVRQHFRYWTGTEPAPSGPAHALRLIVGPEGSRLSNASGPISAFAAMDVETLLNRSQFGLWYGIDGRASSLTTDGARTGDVLSVVSVAYSNQSQPANGTNWTSRAVITWPSDGLAPPASPQQRVEHRLFDGWGGTLGLVVVNQAAAGQAWITSVTRDAFGRAVAVGTPASHVSFDPTTGAISPSASQGLTYRLERVPPGGGSGNPAAAAGLIAEVHAREGHGPSGSVSQLLQQRTWEIRSVSIGGAGVSRAWVHRSRVYPSSSVGTSGSADETTYTWSFVGNSLRPAAIVTQLPVVPTAKNGSGTSLSRVMHFWPDGSPSVSVSEAGRLELFENCSTTGLPIRHLFDAMVSDVPSGATRTGPPLTDWVSSAPGPALRRETRSVYDRQGRLSIVATPAIRATPSFPGGIREMRQRFYGRLADHKQVILDVPVVVGTPESPSQWRGMASVAAINHAGVEVAGARVSVGPRSGGNFGAPSTSQSPASTLPANAATLLGMFPAGQGRAVTAYNEVAELSPGGSQIRKWRERVSGAANQWITWRTTYDALGRLRTVQAPDQTTTSMRFDVRGLEIARHRQNVAGDRLVWMREFDHGVAGGNGLVTRLTEYPLPSEPIVREYRYNWRDQLSVIANPHAPHVAFMYDALGRQVGVTTVGELDSTQRGLLLGWDGNGDPGLLLQMLPIGVRHKTELDPLGRPWQERLYGRAPGVGCGLQSPGGGQMTDPDAPLVTNFWRGRHGKVNLVVGETIQRTTYDRGCAADQVHVLASVPATMTYELAVGGVGAADVVLSTTTFGRNRTNGEVVATLTALRDRMQYVPDDAAGGAIVPRSLFTYGGGWSSVTPTALSLPVGVANGVMPDLQLGMFIRDESGRQQIFRDYGRQPVPGELVCLGINCDPSALQERWRESQTHYFDESNLLREISFERSRTTLNMDELGRPQRMCVEPLIFGMIMPIDPGDAMPGYPGIPGCESQPEETIWEYRDTRLISIARSDCTKADSPTQPDWSKIIKKWFPDDPIVRPSGHDWLPNDNSIPIAIQKGGQEEYWVQPDDWGRPRKTWSPRKIIGLYHYPLPAGRLTEISVDQLQAVPSVPPAFSPPAFVRGLAYGPFGEPTGVSQRLPGGCLLDSMNVGLGTWGQMCSKVICMGISCGGGPSGCGTLGVNDPGPTGLRLNETTTVDWTGIGISPTGDLGGQGVGRWSGIRETARSLPGGGQIAVRQTPTNEPFNPINAAIGRAGELEMLLPGQDPTSISRRGYLGVVKPRFFDAPLPQWTNPQHLPLRQPGNLVTPMYWRPTDNFGQPLNDHFLPYLPNGQPAVDLPAPTSPPLQPLYWGMNTYGRLADGTVTTKTVAHRQPLMTFKEGGTYLPASDWLNQSAFDCNGDLIWMGMTGATQSGGGVVQQSLRGGLELEMSALSTPQVPSMAANAAWRIQGWQLDVRGNWTNFWDSRAGGGVEARSAPDGWLKSPPVGQPWTAWTGGVGDRVFASVFNKADQHGGSAAQQQGGSDPGERLLFTQSAGNDVDVSPVFDADGNLIDDGQRWRFIYDGLNRLVGVQRRQNNATAAKFVYNALNQRVAAIYDHSGDGDLANDPAEIYSYDEHWRLVAVYTQGPATNGARPAPVLRERYIWQRGPFGNDGGDHLVLRERDLDGNGEFEERVFTQQNHRGDVVAVYRAPTEAEQAQETVRRVLLERVRYTAYGEPVCYAAADLNLDGRVDQNDELAWLELVGNGGQDVGATSHVQRLDMTGDGLVTETDFALWETAYRQARMFQDPADPDVWVQDAPFDGRAEGGVLSVPTRRGTWNGGTWVMHGVDNRFGFAGYLWDPFLQLYHVRHRVYDPLGGRWLQRDPIGVAGGWNLYEYVGGDPWGYTDPMGLAPECVCADGGQRSAPAVGQGSDKLRDANSFEFLDDYAQRYQAGGGSGGEMKFAAASAAIGAGLRVAVSTTGVAVMIVTPDPTDAVLLGVASKYGVNQLKTVGRRVFGERADGTQVAIKGDDAKSVREAFKKIPILNQEYSSKHLRHNLEAAGVMPRGPNFPEDAHHIVGNSKEALGIRERLKEAGIDINSAENGMFLDRDFHRKMLSNDAYRDEVVAQLTAAKTDAELRERLERLKKSLREREAQFIRQRERGGGAGKCQP